MQNYIENTIPLAFALKNKFVDLMIHSESPLRQRGISVAVNSIDRQSPNNCEIC